MRRRSEQSRSGGVSWRLRSACRRRGAEHGTHRHGAADAHFLPLRPDLHRFVLAITPNADAPMLLLPQTVLCICLLAAIITNFVLKFSACPFLLVPFLPACNADERTWAYAAYSD